MSKRTPRQRFLLHSLWVLVPFVALFGLTWRAWRADEERRRERSFGKAGEAAAGVLATADQQLGAWAAMPPRATAEPPLPEPVAGDAVNAIRASHELGNHAAVLADAGGARSAAGVPLRKLAAFQLLRGERDPSRLAELVAVLAEPPDFITPALLDAAERRFRELGLEPSPVLTDERGRWRRAEAEWAWLQRVRSAGESSVAFWGEVDGEPHLIQADPARGEWRIRSVAEVGSAAETAVEQVGWGLAEGLALRVAVAGREVAGPVGVAGAMTGPIVHGPWQARVCVADESAFARQDTRMRQWMTAVAVGGGLAVVFGLAQAGRAYLRAIELARRQAEFLAAVSHEMRTPLAAVGLLAENLESGVAERAGQSGDHARRIREESQRLGGLVENVLAYARGERSGARDDFDAAALVREAVSLVGPLAARRGVAIEAAIPDCPEPARGDADALRRAVVNLLDNALKHTPAGGLIRCQAVWETAGWWRIEVADTGPGVPPAERERVCEPFYRVGDELRRETPGAGLGLALVKRTAESHGGRLLVGEAPEGGALFTLHLPLRAPDLP